MTHTRSEIKAQIIRAGLTISALLRVLKEHYGWSGSISNLSNKLSRDSLRYREALDIADALGYEIVWRKRPVSRENEIAHFGAGRMESEKSTSESLQTRQPYGIIETALSND